jgi:hypothetical protein
MHALTARPHTPTHPQSHPCPSPTPKRVACSAPLGCTSGLCLARRPLADEGRAPLSPPPSPRSPLPPFFGVSPAPLASLHASWHAAARCMPAGAALATDGAAAGAHCGRCRRRRRRRRRPPPPHFTHQPKHWQAAFLHSFSMVLLEARAAGSLPNAAAAALIAGSSQPARNSADQGSPRTSCPACAREHHPYPSIGGERCAPGRAPRWPAPDPCPATGREGTALCACTHACMRRLLKERRAGAGAGLRAGGRAALPPAPPAPGSFLPTCFLLRALWQPLILIHRSVMLQQDR